jgi:hypothetical protein
MLPEESRFRELILYLARLSETDPKCGRTKLNKLLFYADFTAYRTLGKAISDQPYQKLENGPAPKRFLPVVRALEEEKACAWVDQDYYGKPLKKLIPLREPDLSVFRPEEVELIRSTVEDLRDLNATEVSDLSHRFLGWQAAELYEEIPYNTVFVDDPRPLSPEEMEWAREVIGEYEREQASNRPTA